MKLQALQITCILFKNNFSLDSPAQSVSSGVRAPSPAPSSVPLGSEKPSNVSQDRKVPVPIGTERSARIRQTGTSAPSVIGSNLSTSVGHSGIWSFEGIGGNQGMICSNAYQELSLCISLKYCKQYLTLIDILRKICIHISLFRLSVYLRVVAMLIAHCFLKKFSASILFSSFHHAKEMLILL